MLPGNRDLVVEARLGLDPQGDAVEPGALERKEEGHPSRRLAHHLRGLAVSISIYVLENSIVDFAGSVIAVGGDGAGIYFDAPHLHVSADKEERVEVTF